MTVVRVPYSGYCPELENIQDVTVLFTEVPKPDTSSPEYIASGLLCDYASSIGCSKDKCPLFQACPHP